jgi:hypothetical protein
MTRPLERRQHDLKSPDGRHSDRAHDDDDIGVMVRQRVVRSMATDRNSRYGRYLGSDDEDDYPTARRPYSSSLVGGDDDEEGDHER